MKITLTETEYLARLADLAIAGSTFTGFDGDCYIQDSERENALQELHCIVEDPDLLAERVWFYNATVEQAAAREYMENGPYGRVEA
jgi:hypothetical protein